MLGELLPRPGRPSSSSVKRVFSETIKGINAKFSGKVAVYHISRQFFSFLKILNFWILTFFIFINIGPYGNENFKTLLILQLWFFLTQFYIFPVTVLTKLAYRNFQISNLKFKKKKRLKFSLKWEPMGVKISKRYSSYNFDSFSTKPFLNIPCNNPYRTSFLEDWNF